MFLPWCQTVGNAGPSLGKPRSLSRVLALTGSTQTLGRRYCEHHPLESSHLGTWEWHKHKHKIRHSVTKWQKHFTHKRRVLPFPACSAKLMATGHVHRVLKDWDGAETDSTLQGDKLHDLHCDRIALIKLIVLYLTSLKCDHYTEW